LLFSSIVKAQNNYQVTFNFKNLPTTDKTIVDVSILNFDILPSENNSRLASFSKFPAGNYQAKISAEGYATQVVSFYVDKNTEIDILMQPDYKILGDVIVNANKRDLNLFSVPGSITSLNSKQIRDMRIWEVSDLSGLAPNLFLSNSGDNRKGL
jgi:iron complex outermembrane receptor protein